MLGVMLRTLVERTVNHLVPGRPTRWITDKVLVPPWRKSPPNGQALAQLVAPDRGWSTSASTIGSPSNGFDLRAGSGNISQSAFLGLAGV